MPRDSISRAEMRDQRAVAQYELANALFRAAGRPDSAQTWFRRVLDETPDHPVVPQALYGLAQAHRAQGDTAAGDDVYRRLIDEHPDTPIARRAREQLGLATTDEDPERTVSRADSAYARAYEAWRSGRHDAALRAFLKVADAHRETSVAPRALLAAGVVYHRTARHDSSGQGRARFTHYADSLAQADAPDPGPDPTGSSSPDATAPAPPSSDAATPARPGPADTTDASAPEGPPRRMIDSTAVANQGASGTPSDSAVASPSVVRDTTTGPSGRTGPPDTTTSAVARETARSDSTSAAPQSRREPADPFEILLSHLVARYPETAEAERAQALLDQLRERRSGQKGTTGDSTGARAPNGPGANRESGTVAPEVDTTKDRPRPPDEAAGPAAPSSARAHHSVPIWTREGHALPVL